MKWQLGTGNQTEGIDEAGWPEHFDVDRGAIFLEDRGRDAAGVFLNRIGEVGIDVERFRESMVDGTI